MLLDPFTWVVLFVLILVLVFGVLVGWAKTEEGSIRTRHMDRNVQLGPTVGVKSIQGSRAYMEDTYQVCANLTGEVDPDKCISVYGVFDGHGGKRASEFVGQELLSILRDEPDLPTHPDLALIKAFEKTDQRWLHAANTGGFDDGSTAIVALIVGKMLYLANLGDCRAVLSQDGRSVDLSHDHKPIRSDEKARIEALGGRIKFHGTWRVEGALAVTRAFGDRRYKRFLTATPEITCHRLTDQDEFLILASDGLWDVLSSQDAVDQVLVGHIGTLSGKNDVNKELCVRGANHLTNTAYKAGSMDNITTMVVDLRSHYRSACSKDARQLKGFRRRRALAGEAGTNSADSD